jgi:putative transposase
LRDAVLAREAEPVIPPKFNRRAPLPYDKALYKERNLVERFFNKLKQFRRVATRYDKLLANYRGFVLLAAQINRHYGLATLAFRNVKAA